MRAMVFIRQQHGTAIGRLIAWLLGAWLGLQPAHAQVAAHILLQDSPLAGFQYHAGKRLWPQMQVGDALALVREPENVHDAKAVRVEWQGQKIGYVPRRENADVARFMDNGQILAARITRLAEVRDPWSRLRFEILIPVQPASVQPASVQPASVQPASVQPGESSQ
ncbi:MAG: HIRAN domain-containing protein [Gammaproteobacteria bacterium]